jgi:siroheme synthase
VSATQPQQQTIAGTVADIAERLAALAPTGPVLVMIGRALARPAEAAGADATAAKETQAQPDDPGDPGGTDRRKHAS